MLLLAKRLPVISRRVPSLLFVLGVLGTGPTTVEAVEPACAARLLAKQPFPDYLAEIRDIMGGSQTLQQAQRFQVLDNTVESYYERAYAPRDTVCIVDPNTTEHDLIKAGVFDGYGGDVFLLVPRVAGKPIGAEVKTSKFGRISNAKNSLIRNIQVDISNRLRSYHGRNCPIADSPEGDACLRGAEKQTDKDMEKLQAERFKDPLLTLISTFEYEPNAPTASANLDVFTSWINRFVSGEIVNVAFYIERRIGPRNTAEAAKVFDPIENRPIRAYSFIEFVGATVDAALLDTIFDEYLGVLDDFAGDRPRVEAINLEELDSVQYNAFNTRGPLEEMFRGFICLDGAGAMATPRDFSPEQRTGIPAFKFFACSSLSIDGKPIVEFSRNLDLDPDSVFQDLLLLAGSFDANKINTLLLELGQIQVDQIATLNEIHRYVATGFFDSQISELSQRLSALQEASKRPNLLELAASVGGVASGVGTFVGGFEGLRKLFKGVPGGSLDKALSYFWKKKDSFSKEGKAIANGADQIAKGLDVIEKFLKPREATNGVAAVRESLRRIREQKQMVIAEINRTAAKYEQRLSDIYHELYLLEIRRYSLRRDVAVSLYRTVPLHFISSLSVSAFYERIEACHNAVARYERSSDNFEPASLNYGCGGISDQLRRVRACLRGHEDNDRALITRGKNTVYLVGNRTAGSDCFNR